MYRPLIFTIALVVVVLDQITKFIAVSQLENQPPVSVIGNFLQFSFVRNPGAAFSIGTNITIVYSIFEIVVSLFIVLKSKLVVHRLWAVAAGGFLGGALGNLADRIFRSPGYLSGHVVDFIELPNYPLFNIADSAIVLSAIAAVVLSLRGIEIDQVRK